MSKVSVFLKLLRKLWPVIKKVILEIIRLLPDIIDFFRLIDQTKGLKKDELAVSIKEKMDNGQYHVVNCLYNEKTESVSDIQETVGMESNKMDDEAINAFGDKEMVILN